MVAGKKMWIAGMLTALVLGAVLMGPVGCAAPRAATGGSEVSREQVERAIERVKPALVRIHVVGENYYAGRTRKQQSSGSGFIISPDGYVVTNHHVAGKAVRLVCTMSDREEIPARLVGADAMADVAVIQLTPNKPRKFPFVQFGDSTKIRVGDPVLAMGSPLALSQSVTEGIVSNTAMIMPGWGGQFELDGENVGSIVRWIAHDAAIFPGNSGGPLVDLEGKVVGINEISFGLGGAIPSELARPIVTELIKTGDVERAFWGFLLQPLFKHDLATEGAIVSDVIKGSPAQQAGIKTGDRITAITTAGLTGPQARLVYIRFMEELPPLNQWLAQWPIAQAAKIKLLRDGQPMEIEMTPVKREPVLHDQEELKAWGMTVRDLSIWTALEMKRESKDGVLVTSLRSGGPAGQAKPALNEGDVIVKVGGQPVANVAQLQKVTAGVLEQAQEIPAPVLVTFERKGQQLMTQVEVGLDELDDPGREVRKAWIPVDTQVLTRELAEGLGLDGTTGVRVTQLYEPEGSTATLGLEVGDLIVQLDGEPIPASQPHQEDVFATMVRQYPVGSEVTLGVLRDGEAIELSGLLSMNPPMPREMKRYQDHDFEFTVRNVAYLDRREQKLEDEARGVLVSGVEEGGWAALAGLGVGDLLVAIDQQPTPTVARVRKQLAQLKEQQAVSVIFKVRRGAHLFYLELEPVWPDGNGKN